MKNLGDMMKQVQQMQTRMQEAQDKLEEMTVSGEAGGGLVKVVLNGKGAMQSVTIDESLMKPEEREIVEDLVLAACNDARAHMEQMVSEQMQSVTGGLQLPPGMKLPF